MSRLSGRVVVVTGASRGTGLAIARAAAGEGAAVVMLARNADSLAAAAREVGPRAIAVPADLGDPTSVNTAFVEIERRFGRLDAVVNNAAVAWPRRIEDLDDARLQQQVATNLLGPMYTARAAIPLLRRSPDAHIVNISSESATEPFPYLLVYAATKAGLETFTRGLAHEVRGDGIRVCLLRSGRTDTGFKDGWDLQERAEAVATWQREGFTDRVSGGAVQPPERIAEAAVFVLTQPRGTQIGVIDVRAHDA